MTRSSAMASRSVLPPRSPRGAFLPARSGPVPFSMPLGLILGRPFTPLSWATSARSSAIACCSAAFSASRRSARVSSSPRGRPEREIVLGAGMPGEIESNSVPHNPSAHPSPDFCPSYDGRQDVVEIVGDTAGQRADRLQLLGLAELGFQRALAGDVAAEQDATPIRHPGLADPHPTTVGEM